MNILAIESSGKVASAAIVKNGKAEAEFNITNKKTHSRNLMPMIKSLYEFLDMQPEETDIVAVSKGPGSFTGLRIGSAAAKGISFALDIPIAEISSLEAMAYQMFGCDGLICSVIDARRNQVYAGIYSFSQGRINNVYKDAALSICELTDILNKSNSEAILLGDGVSVYKEEIIKSLKIPFKFAKSFQNRQRAASLGVLAFDYAKDGRLVSSDEHYPEYLRLPQAERERLKKINL